MNIIKRMKRKKYEKEYWKWKKIDDNMWNMFEKYENEGDYLKASEYLKLHHESWKISSEQYYKIIEIDRS